MSLKDLFISVVVDTNQHGITDAQLIKLSQSLEKTFDNYEIIIVEDDRNSSFNKDLLHLCNNIRYIQIFKQFNISFSAVGIENSIGDITVYGDINELSINNICTIVKHVCADKDVVITTPTLITATIKFGAISRRAINALVQRKNFLTNFTAEVTSCLGKYYILDNQYYPASPPHTEEYDSTYYSIITYIWKTLLILGIITSILTNIAWLTAISLLLYIMPKKRLTGYLIKHDLHSSVMLNENLLNVVSESIDDTINMTQSGRNH